MIKLLEYLDAIVKRANPNKNSKGVQPFTVDRVLLERRKELIGEGHRFFDAMRNNETVIRYTIERRPRLATSIERGST